MLASVRKFAQTHDVLTKTIHATLRKDLLLSKKLARWVTKLPNKNMKNERVRKCKAFIALITTAPSPSWTIFSTLMSQLGVESESELTGLTLTQEAS